MMRILYWIALYCGDNTCIRCTNRMICVKVKLPYIIQIERIVVMRTSLLEDNNIKKGVHCTVKREPMYGFVFEIM